MKKNSELPQVAVWMLRYLGQKNNRDIILGDLMERSRTGQSPVRLWREVFTVISAGAIESCRIRYLEFSFALVGAVLLSRLQFLMRVPAIERLWTLGIGLAWPLASLYDFGFRSAVAAITAELIIFPMLLINRALTWKNVLRSFVISFSILFVGLLNWFLFWAAFPHLLASLIYSLPPFLAILISVWSSHSLRRASFTSSG